MIAVDTHPIKNGNRKLLSFKAYFMSHAVSSRIIIMMYTCISSILSFGDYRVLIVLFYHVSVSCEYQDNNEDDSCSLDFSKHPLCYPSLDICHRFINVMRSIPISAKYFEVFFSRSFRDNIPAL